jgi:hypothetical protein
MNPPNPTAKGDGVVLDPEGVRAVSIGILEKHLVNTVGDAALKKLHMTVQHDILEGRWVQACTAYFWGRPIHVQQVSGADGGHGTVIHVSCPHLADHPEEHHVAWLRSSKVDQAMMLSTLAFTLRDIKRKAEISLKLSPNLDVRTAMRGLVGQCEAALAVVKQPIEEV